MALPLVNVAKEMYRLAMRQGLADRDFSAIYSFVNQSTDRPEPVDSNLSPAFPELER